MADLGAWFHRYSYFGTELMGALAIPLVFLVPKAQRRTALVSGAILVPWMVVAPFHSGFPSGQPYWVPTRVGGFPFGVEDGLFNFFLGFISWSIAAMVSELPIVEGTPVLRAVWRATLFSIAGALAWALFAAIGFSPMGGICAVFAVFVAILTARTPRRLKGAMVAGVGYTAFHLGCLFAGVSIWPEFLSAWSPGLAPGEGLLHVAMKEGAFAILAATAHPLALAFILDKGTPGSHPI